MHIDFLKNTQIDKLKWNSTIEDSTNGLVYALSWYLDIVASEWDALILGDYEIIMPLPSKLKFEKKILYQPIFAHQLGVFSKHKFDENIIEQFINEAIRHFPFIDIKLNNDNPTPEQKYFYQRQTQTLNLNASYNEIASKYNRSLKSNLSKSKRTDFIYSYCDSPAILIDAMREMYKRKNIEGIKESDFNNLAKIIDYSVRYGIGKIYCASIGSQLCSAIFVLTWQNRAYTFYGTSSLGREKRSLVALMDQLIRENAGKNLFLDFCGSNIPGVAEWNLGFGAQNHTYFGVHVNNLPLWLKWIRKIS